MIDATLFVQMNVTRRRYVMLLAVGSGPQEAALTLH